VAKKKTTTSGRTPNSSKTKRKTAKKSGVTKKSKSSGTKSSVAKKSKSSGTKSSVAKRGRSPAKKRAASDTRVRKSKVPFKPTKGIARKTKRKVVRKKPTKKERRAAHPQNRKPQTNYSEAKSYFGSEDRKWTPKITQELKMVFLRAYATKGIILVGTSAADISRLTYKRWRETDAHFDEACKEAEQMATDLLEKVARGRAEDGVDHPVIYQGEITDTYKVYSDSLMKTLLEGAAPEKYKQRTEHSGSVGRPLTLDTETKDSVVSSILGMITNKPDPKT